VIARKQRHPTIHTNIPVLPVQYVTLICMKRRKGGGGGGVLFRTSALGIVDDKTAGESRPHGGMCQEVDLLGGFRVELQHHTSTPVHEVTRTHTHKRRQKRETRTHTHNHIYIYNRWDGVEVRNDQERLSWL